ncbi:hypothetical protein AHAS_Ahas01G0149400 [Arachis hypogaea]
MFLASLYFLELSQLKLVIREGKLLRPLLCSDTEFSVLSMYSDGTVKVVVVLSGIKIGVAAAISVTLELSLLL